MQNEKMNSHVKKVIALVWNFMNRIRTEVPFNISIIFNSMLLVLYAYHKKYETPFSQINNPASLPKDDTIYSDLLKLLIFDNSTFHLALHFRKFISDLESQIDRDEFNAIYVDVLRELFDMLSSKSGKEESEFYTPYEIRKLIAYIVNKEQCNSVFDPFCGTASIIHELSSNGTQLNFYGQEINQRVATYAKLIAESIYGSYECISNVDSITNWSDSHYDAVVTCPPLALSLTPDSLYKARIVTPNVPCRSYEDIILYRPFYCNDVKLSITHLPIGFCFRGGYNYELRKDLVERNLVDAVIELPKGILYATGVPSIILVCKKNRKKDEPVKIIHAEEYFLGLGRQRVLDIQKLIDMMEGDAMDVDSVSLDDIRLFNYDLTPSLYHKIDIELTEGQRTVYLEELLTPVEGESISTKEVQNFISRKNLSQNFIEVLLNKGKYYNPKDDKVGYYCKKYNASSKKYLLVHNSLSDRRYGINTDGKDFVCISDIKVYEINDDLVSPEYLVYTLLHNVSISRGRTPLVSYMKFPIVIDSLKKQEEIVNKEKQKFNQKVEEERKANALRLGVKQNVSDLEHMLGSTQLRINKIIRRLEKATPATKEYPQFIKSLKDNVEYMNRIIKYNSENIDSQSFNIQDGNIVDFIKNYANGWNNYGGGYFELSVTSNLGKETNLNFDNTLLIVMLDSILNNASKHGFHKREDYTEHNIVDINLSIVNYDNKPYLLLSVANNGDPISDGFTINDYISRGLHTANTGNSGLGGFHVYQIVKGHDGYLFLGSNKIWNMIVDVLLPIDSIILDNIPEYENECI